MNPGLTGLSVSEWGLCLGKAKGKVQEDWGVCVHICACIFVFYVFIVYFFMCACEQNPSVDGRTGPLNILGLFCG